MKSPKIPEPLLVFAGAFIFFLCTLAENFSGPHDSIGYLNGIVSGKHLSHPHHLLYHFTAHYWLVFTQGIFPGIKDYYLVETFTALCGSGSVAVIYCFFRNRFKLTAWVSVLNTSVIVFSYGVWFYSTNIEVYAPPMFLLLASLYILTKEKISRNDFLKAALLHALAILYHQFHALFTPVVLYIIWNRRHEIKLVPSLIQYTVIGIVLVGGTYFLMGWVVEGQNSPEKWVHWMQGYTRAEAYWQKPGLKTAVNVFTGYSHAFIGGHFIFRIPGLRSYIDRSLASHSLHDEIYLGRHISEPTAIILTVLSIFLAITMLLLVIRFIRRFKSLRRQYGLIIIPIILTGTVYSIFFCAWMPEILEFWIFQTVLFWLLLLGTLPVTGFPFRLKPLTGTICLSLSLLVVNYFGSVRWLQHLDNDWYYTKVVPVQKIVSDKDVILLQQGWILKDFLNYFTKADVQEVPFADSLRPAVDKAIHDGLARGGKLYIYPGPNNMINSPDTYYIDSLLKDFGSRIQVFHKEDPLILVVEGQ